MQIEITSDYLASQGLSYTFPERFWRRVIKTDGCWDWSAYKDRDGYGTIKTGVDGKTIKAHRASYVLNVGPIPDGLLVLHSCDCPSCSNFYHLFLGTRIENRADCVKKCRQAKGETNGLAKLTDSSVREIIEVISHEKMGDVAKLSKKFGIERHTISRIRNGEIWRHISRAELVFKWRRHNWNREHK